jgi:SRSO17 transposase
MGRRKKSGDGRFESYIKEMAAVLGHADRVAPMHDYCLGLVLPGERKSVEPMAAVTAPARVAAQHQSLLHFIANGAWSDHKVLDKVRAMVLPEIERKDTIEAWIIDDTGFPKKGKHSVGVARQYCGQLGKQDNCQAAVSLSLANRHASLPVRYQLYLPQEWASDARRRKKAGVPEEIVFQTKPEIALDQLRWAVQSDLPRGVVLLDAGYGHDRGLREDIRALGLNYVAGILSTASVWGSDSGPLPPKPYAGRGRPPTRPRRDKKHKPVSVKELAFRLPDNAWRAVTWREGSGGRLSSRFARVRVRTAGYRRTGTEEWLLIEWPKCEKEPTKYWLSTLPEEIAFSRLVDLTKLRWRIERDYQDLKQEIGLGHYEGRGWRGFHHHATLCIVAYGFLISEREAIPPSAPRFPQLKLPRRYRPRGAADPAGTTHSQLNRDRAPERKRRSRQKSGAMSVLHAPKQAEPTAQLVTQ